MPLHCVKQTVRDSVADHELEVLVGIAVEGISELFLLHQTFVVVRPYVEPEAHVYVLVLSFWTFDEQVLYVERSSFANLIKIEAELALLVV